MCASTVSRSPRPLKLPISSVQPFVPSLKSSRVRMRGNGLYLDRRTSEARIALRIAEVSAAVSTEVTFEHSFLPPGASVLIIGGSRDASTLALMRRRAQGACGGYVRAGSPTGAAVLICVYPQVSGDSGVQVLTAVLANVRLHE